MCDGPCAAEIARVLGRTATVRYSGLDAEECYSASLAQNRSIERLTLHKRTGGLVDGLSSLNSAIRSNTTLRDLRYRAFVGGSNATIVDGSDIRTTAGAP